MRLLFVADGRSPTTLSWIKHWPEAGHEVHLISTYPSKTPPGLASFHVIPVALSKMAGGGGIASRSRTISRLRAILRPLRYLLGPVSLRPHQQHFLRLIESLNPDLVHALRIPYEGMLASVTPTEIPFLVSIWGNDITLHARSSRLMAVLTRRVLRRADGLLADTQRDLRLGRDMGLREATPSLVVPGGGGIQFKEMEAVARSATLPEDLPKTHVVVNSRGHRPGSLRQDVFFRAIPLILEKVPDAYFVCPPLAGDPIAEGWVDHLGIKDRARLWPMLDQAQLWSLMKKSQVFVSPSLHDGTPNSLIEAMACGCIPVVGNIDSMREWITNGLNGLLVDASDERMLAIAIVRALNEPALQIQAAQVNADLIAERADYGSNMQRVEMFYRAAVSKI
jgi:glycosyltransferase involved in cell wall biosynthesis